MRLWSLHPRYLDRAGLVALWREALLAQAVLRGATGGYRHHPQLIRFRSHPDPAAAIARYLEEIDREADRRGYRFDQTKIGPCRTAQSIAVTRGQLRYEREHLLRKLRVRAPLHVAALAAAGEPDPHPLFRAVAGGIEPWERIRPQ
ncbi:MAG: pyrimidine dimer DNA glycosylase/endonuclease V [Syntrophales bacterium]